LRKIENNFGLCGGPRSKCNVGGCLAHRGERGAGAHGERRDSGEQSYQSPHASPPSLFLSWYKLGSISSSIVENYVIVIAKADNPSDQDG
jgi:hypothetical protein